MTVYTTFPSPLGELLLVGEEPGGGPGGESGGGPGGGSGSGPGTAPAVALDSLSVPGQRRGAVVREGWRADPRPFADVTAQLAAYFAGDLTRFDVPVTARGTDFQRRVWAALEDIPYGATTTYGALAARIGAPRAAVRAVGAAIGANPLLVIRPCHRVIGADRALTGYAGGLDRKRRLLGLEGVALAG
jgi:methylated-DNA-[protein]-cysteine S-methyltransferase